MELRKISNGEYKVIHNGELIGVAFKNHKGLYEIELPNRITVQAVNQNSLKRMILKAI